MGARTYVIIKDEEIFAALAEELVKRGAARVYPSMEDASADGGGNDGDRCLLVEPAGSRLTVRCHSGGLMVSGIRAGLAESERVVAVAATATAVLSAVDVFDDFGFWPSM